MLHVNPSLRANYTLQEWMIGRYMFIVFCEIWLLHLLIENSILSCCGLGHYNAHTGHGKESWTWNINNCVLRGRYAICTLCHCSVWYQEIGGWILTSNCMDVVICFEPCIWKRTWSGKNINWPVTINPDYVWRLWICSLDTRTTRSFPAYLPCIFKILITGFCIWYICVGMVSLQICT